MQNTPSQKRNLEGVEHICSNCGQTVECDLNTDLYEACKAQHKAVDILFAMLIERDKDFFPSKSGEPWEALLKGDKAIAKVGRLDNKK